MRQQEQFAHSGVDVARAVRDCAYNISQLVAANDGDPTPVRTQVVAHVKSLLDRPDLIGFGLKRPGQHAEESWILYYDPQLMIVLGRGAAGKYDPPHNHGGWLATGVYRGAMEYRGYDRFDDLTKPNFADIRKTEERLLKAGDVALTRPPPHDIHEVKFVTDNYGLVVLGGAFNGNREYYDVINKCYTVKTEKK